MIHKFQIIKPELKKIYPNLFSFANMYINDWTEEEALHVLMDIVKHKSFIIDDIDKLIEQMEMILKEKSNINFINDVATFMFSQGGGKYEDGLRFIEKLYEILIQYNNAFKMYGKEIKY